MPHHGRRRAAARRRGRGPLPQTRYVLSKAIAAGLPAVVVINKVDRADARPDEVLDEVYQLFIDLATHADHLDFPIVSAVAREGRSMIGIGMPGPGDDLSPLLEALRWRRSRRPTAMPRLRCRRSSRTSTRRTTSAGWRSVGS